MQTQARTNALFLEKLEPLLDAVARPPSGEPSSAGTLRSSALEAFRKDGLPDRTWESWRHSDPSFLWEQGLQGEPAGCFETVDSPGGLNVTPEGAATGSPVFDWSGRPLAALQAALSRQVLVVRVPRGFASDKALILGHRLPASGSLTTPTLHLILEEGASLSVRLEHQGGAADALALPAVRMFLAKGSSLTWLEHDAGAGGSRRISLLEASLDEGARLDAGFLLSGGAWVRQDLDVRLAGPGASAVLKGLTLGRENQHLDIHTFTDHAAPGGVSEQVFKGLATDRATVVFNGSVLVREGASGTDARQNNRNLVLSDEAVVFSEPRLEIYHDDVRCTHGSATGPLDEEGVFYLRSRGIDEKSARRLLLEAFVSEVVGSEGPLAEEAGRWLRETEAAS